MYGLWQRAPIPEWQDDARKNIRIADIMRMSSGIRIVAPQDPDYTEEMGYPDHLYLYTGEKRLRVGRDPPAAVGAEHGGTVPEHRPGADETTWSASASRGAAMTITPSPSANLFRQARESGTSSWRRTRTENFLTQGYEFGSARDWARLGNLYLQDGVWDGERILPEGYVDYAMEVAPAWIADGRPVYGGGFVWKDLGFPIEDDYGGFGGAGGQYTVFVPARGLVITRLGKYTGQGARPGESEAAIALLMEAVPLIGD